MIDHIFNTPEEITKKPHILPMSKEAKYPYETTKAEFYEQPAPTSRYYGLIMFDEENKPYMQTFVGEWSKAHKKTIENALKVGRTVPKEVLKDYPGVTNV